VTSHIKFAIDNVIMTNFTFAIETCYVMLKGSFRNFMPARGRTKYFGLLNQITEVPNPDPSNKVFSIYATRPIVLLAWRCDHLPSQGQATGNLESTTRPFEGKMGWLPWSSSTSHSPPTVLPGEPANTQESLPPQNASTAASSNRALTRPSSTSNPLGPIKDALVSEGDGPKLRSVFAEFMNGQAAPFVRPLAASPWVQN